jgi:uncharacterized protein (TIGR00290 family)
MSRKKILISWSSGKDSAWALYLLRQSGDYEIVGLLTTLNRQFDRVAMHSTRREILEAQAAAAGLPLWEVPLPWPCSNADYEALMEAACRRAREQNVEAIAFGDLYLEDIRRYREEKLAGTGIAPIFPVWGLDTRALVAEMLCSGLCARIVTVDPKKLPRSFAGRDLDGDLIADLPEGVDPCGENGEFHTVVHRGPMFRQPIPVTTGEIVDRDGFVFADVMLGG